MLKTLSAPTVSGYLHVLPVSAASVKLTASALRHWLDFLTERGVLEFNPALSVRTQRLVVTNLVGRPAPSGRILVRL